MEKRRNSTLRRAEIPKSILTKLGIFYYIWDSTSHDNFGGGSSTLVIWAHSWLVTYPGFFFLLFFFCFLRHAYRSYFYRSWRSICHKAGFCPSMCLLGVLTIRINPKNFPKWAEIRIFKPKRRKVKIDMSRNVLSQLTQNFLQPFDNNMASWVVW